MIISRYISLGILATVPVLFAAVQAWVWSVYAALMMAAFGLMLWQSADDVSLVPGKGMVVTVGGFLALTLFLCLPLPETLQAFFNPMLSRLAGETQTVTGLPAVKLAMSYAPAQSLARWMLLFSLSLFFLVLRGHLNARRFLTTTLWMLFILGTLEALYGLVQALVPNLGVLWVDTIHAYLGDARGTYINRNHFAGFLEMLLPLLLGFALSKANWQRETGRSFYASDRPQLQLLLAVGLVFMVLALLLSRSRAGITATFIGMTCLFLLLRSGGSRLPGSVNLTFFGIFFLVAFFGFKIGFDSIIERFLNLPNNTSRLDFWRDSLAIIKTHPWGTGLWTFKPVFAIHNVSTIADLTVFHLHNDYLQLIVETGWAGFCLLAGGFFVFLIGSFRKLRSLRIEDAPFRYLVAAGALSGLVAMAFHSLFDFNLQMPANCTYFVMLMVIVHTQVWRKAEGNGKNDDQLSVNRYPETTHRHRGESVFFSFHPLGT